MARYPVAYIRRSSADADNPGDISRDAQEAAVRELAHRDGHNGDLRIFDDWNRSADVAKEAKREAFTSLLADIEAGKVSAVYAYALDRLYRSMRTFVRLTDAAKANDVRIVTLREGVLGGDGSPMAQAFAQITAVFSELELNTAKARARGALEARRQRGDALGQAPYGWKHERQNGRLVRVRDPKQPIEPILAAYNDSAKVNGKADGKRTVLGACALLEARGMRAPRGGTRWSTSLVTRILAENAPEALPRKSRTGRRQPASAILSGLLVCPFCDRTMTPNTTRGQYYCANGPRERATHPRYTVTERDVLPWVMDEADRFDPPGNMIEAERDAAQADALRAQRAKVLNLYLVDPKADPDDIRRRIAAMPWVGCSARISTALAEPAFSQTKFTHQWMP